MTVFIQFAFVGFHKCSEKYLLWKIAQKSKGALAMELFFSKAVGVRKVSMLDVNVDQTWSNIRNF